MSVCEGKDDRKRTIHRGSRYEVIVEGYVGDTRDVLLVGLQASTIEVEDVNDAGVSPYDLW